MQHLILSCNFCLLMQSFREKKALVAGSVACIDIVDITALILNQFITHIKRFTNLIEY